MTADEIIDELRPLGKESYKKVLLNHGIPEPIFGVKIEDMKKIVKREKANYELALALYDSGIYDAMYLAGLLADDQRMTKKDLKRWANNATCPMLCQFTVAWVAAGSKHGRELALEWIESKKENLACTGWGTLSALVSITEDDDLDIPELKGLLDRVAKTIHAQPNRVRLVMNYFLIAAGSYSAALTAPALAAAAKVGKVSVDMGDTDCKVPNAAEYIEKVRARGSIGKKRKSAKC